MVLFSSNSSEKRRSLLDLQVIYGTAVSPANSNFSPLAPLAAGLAIYVAREAGAPYTGSPLNPARLIGPALVFFCNWRHFWAWMLGKSTQPCENMMTKCMCGCVWCGDWLQSSLRLDCLVSGELLASVAVALFVAGSFGVGDAYAANREVIGREAPGLEERLMPEG